jgi:hypothetical protein
MRKILKIDSDGNIQCLYADSLHALGKVKDVARASHVEPNPDGGWDVTLTDDPRNGEYKGAFIGNYPTRREALEAEVSFINANILEGVNYAR